MDVHDTEWVGVNWIDVAIEMFGSCQYDTEPLGSIKR
jgi:hypothetical protein